MIRFLVRGAIFLGSAAIGLLVAKAVVDQMTISWSSFVYVVVIFAVLQSVLAPFIARTASRNAPALWIATMLATLLLPLVVAKAAIGAAAPPGWTTSRDMRALRIPRRRHDRHLLAA